MHEMSLAQSIFDIAVEEARKHAAKQVKRIMVDVGALSCVDPHALTFGFEAVKSKTALEAATLEIRTVPAEAYCFGCDSTVELAHLGAACPKCHSRKIVTTQGDDLKVSEMEIV